MHRRYSLLLPPLAPLGAMALMTSLGTVTACLSDNPGTIGAMGGSAVGGSPAGGSNPISAAGGSDVTTGGSGGGVGGSITSGTNAGGAAPVTPKICDSSLEAESMTHSTGEAVEMGWNIYTDGDISGSHDFKGGSTTITVTAKGAMAGGEWPHMKVHVAGNLAGEIDVNTDAWAPYPFKVTPSAGKADIKIEFTNDGKDDSGGDRNLYVDKVAVSENCDGSGTTVPGELKDPVGRVPELGHRIGQVLTLLGCLARHGDLALSLQRIVEIGADACELIRPRGQGIRLAAVEHVAHREANLVQVVLNAQQLQRVASIAIGEVGLEAAQP